MIIKQSVRAFQLHLLYLQLHVSLPLPLLRLFGSLPNRLLGLRRCSHYQTTNINPQPTDPSALAPKCDGATRRRRATSRTRRGTRTRSGICSRNGTRTRSSPDLLEVSAADRVHRNAAKNSELRRVLFDSWSMSRSQHLPKGLHQSLAKLHLPVDDVLPARISISRL